jgi:hypothetical protein
MSKKTSIQSDTQVRRPVDVQTRKSASDVQTRRLSFDPQARHATDDQARLRSYDLQARLRSDAQVHLPQDILQLLVERYESTGRVYEAEAELALARGGLARIDARLLEAGYYPPK